MLTPMAETLTLDCGHPESPHSDITRGYGTRADGTRHCYDCCQRFDLETIASGEPIVAYVSSDKRSIVNWPGRELMRIRAIWTSKRARKTYCTAIDRQGKQWSGVGPAESGTYVRLRPMKAGRHV